MAATATVAGVMVGIGAAASAATAATLYVDPSGTSTTCTGPGTAACATVQQAVTRAETYSATDVTVAIAAGTYTGNVDVGTVPSGDTLTLRGAGPAATVFDVGGNGTVVSQAGGTLTLVGLEITGGQASSVYMYRGGGVAAAGGSLTLRDVRVSKNAASNEGGGVWSHGTSLTIDASTIDGNVDSGSYNGGGVHSNALTTTVRNATFDANIDTSGVGADLAASSAGYYGPRPPEPPTAVVTISGSTFADDVAGPFGPASPTGLALLPDTPSGGPVSVTVTGSIFSASGCSVSDSGSMVLTDGGGNVDSGDTCHLGSASRTNSSTIGLSHTLSANNHPDAPPTLAIASDSAARNFVPSGSCPATDERGVSRAGATCDAGAFEYVEEALPPTAGEVDLTTHGEPVSTDLAQAVDTHGLPGTYAVGRPGPTQGTATVSGSVLTYTPGAGAVGPDRFTYTVRTAGGTATGTVAVLVLTPPTAYPDKAATFGSRTGPGTTIAIEVLGNDTPGYGSLVVSAVTKPGHGTAVVNPNAPNVLYTPAKGFFGKDTFTYTADNGNGTSSAKVTVVVRH